MNNSNRFLFLIQKRLLGIDDNKDYAELNELIQDNKIYHRIYHRTQNPSTFTSRKAIRSHFDVNKGFLRFKINHIKRRRISAVWTIAASVVIFLGSIYFFNKTSEPQNTVENVQSIQAGYKHALLVMDDGLQVQLDTLQVSSLSIRSIRVSSDGLDYSQQTVKNAKNEQFNTLYVPYRGEYYLILEDSTQVWLNSNSRLRYPSRFTANHRTVYLEGEAYFQVKHNTDRPFNVVIGDYKVAVLGTSFNVRLDEDKFSAALLKGSIALTTSDQEIILHPRTQAIVNRKDGRCTIDTIQNINHIIGWQKGRFVYQSERLETIMNDMKKWYDLNVIYVGPNIKEMRFTINMSRYANFNDVARILEATNTVKITCSSDNIRIEEK